MEALSHLVRGNSRLTLLHDLASRVKSSDHGFALNGTGSRRHRLVEARITTGAHKLLLAAHTAVDGAIERKLIPVTAQGRTLRSSLLLELLVLIQLPGRVLRYHGIRIDAAVECEVLLAAVVVRMELCAKLGAASFAISDRQDLLAARLRRMEELLALSVSAIKISLKNRSKVVGVEFRRDLFVTALFKYVGGVLLVSEAGLVAQFIDHLIDFRLDEFQNTRFNLRKKLFRHQLRVLFSGRSEGRSSQ